MRLPGRDRPGRDDDARRVDRAATGVEHRSAVDAGAYVLASLSVPERLTFEAHLAGCAGCRRAVDDVAALPALLDLVPADVVRSVSAGAGPVAGVPVGSGAGAAGADDEDAPLRVPSVAFRVPDLARDPGPPPMLLADLLRVARHEEQARLRRRRWLGGSLAAVAVTAIALAISGGPAGLPWRSEVPAPTIAGEAIELAPLLDVPVRASVQLDPVAWGTRIDLRCTYDGPAAGGDPYAGDPYAGDPYAGDPADGAAGATAYSLVVRDAAGNVEEVATWTAVPGHEVTVPAATGMPRDEIVEVELRSGGTPVLRAQT